MRTPQLVINQQSTVINLRTREPEIEVERKKPSLEIRQLAGKLEIKSSSARVEVDSYPARYDLGYKNSRDISRDIAAKGQQAVMAAVARYAQNGDCLMDFQHNKAADIAAEEASSKPVEIGLKFKRGPVYQVTPAQNSIRYESGKTEIEVGGLNELNRPYIEVNRGRVEAGIEQYADIEISVRGGVFDRSV